MPDIVHRIAIHTPAARVYETLTTGPGLCGWWTRSAKAPPGVGAVLEFTFGDSGFNHMRVVDLEPDRRVHWECVKGGAEWIGTQVTFDLREEGGKTIVLFGQRGWREQIEFMHYCSTKWAVYLLSLKSLCETGTGRPYPDDIDID